MISKNNKNMTILECLRMDSNMVNLSTAAKEKANLRSPLNGVVGANGVEPLTYAL